MKLTDITWQKQKDRRGYLVVIHADSALCALGEIAPLQGFSQESEDDVIEQLKCVKPKLLSLDWTKESLDQLHDLNLHPSVAFGLFSALRELLNPIPTPPHLPIYAHLSGTKEQILLQAASAKKRSFKGAKLKIGSLTVEEAFALWELLSKDFTLRFDCNRAWELDKSTDFFSKLPSKSFAYVEEPAKNPLDLLHFPYPYALDETTREIADLTPWLEHTQLAALIIKPMLLFPFDTLLKHSVPIVLTSSFEGPVGLLHIAKMIGHHKLYETEHGLDTV